MGFSLSLGKWMMLFHGVRRWLGAELAHAWSFIARPRPCPGGMPGPVTPAQAPSPEHAGLPEEPVSVAGRDVP